MAKAGGGQAPPEVILWMRDRAARPVQFGATAAGERLVSGPAILLGYSIRESTGAAAAAVRLRNGADATGAIVATIGLAASGSDTQMPTDPGLICDVGVWLEVVSGSVEGSVHVRDC